VENNDPSSLALENVATLLKDPARRVVGTKQTLRAVERGSALLVFIARDAEARITRQLEAVCRQRGVPVCEFESMKALGRVCNVEVGAASAAIVRG